VVHLLHSTSPFILDRAPLFYHATCLGARRTEAQPAAAGLGAHCLSCTRFGSRDFKPRETPEWMLGRAPRTSRYRGVLLDLEDDCRLFIVRHEARPNGSPTGARGGLLSARLGRASGRSGKGCRFVDAAKLAALGACSALSWLPPLLTASRLLGLRGGAAWLNY